MPNRPHTLYRFFSSADVLLYVGITAHPGQRWRSHAAEKTWWTDVTRVSVEHFPDRSTVLEAERRAIIDEHPLHNVVHNRHPQLELDLEPTEPTEPFETYWARISQSMPDDCHDVCVRAGILSIYFPHLWHHGTAHYTCEFGHTWTCGFGYDGVGGCEENRGKAHARSYFDLNEAIAKAGGRPL